MQANDIPVSSAATAVPTPLVDRFGNYMSLDLLCRHWPATKSDPQVMEYYELLKSRYGQGERDQDGAPLYDGFTPGDPRNHQHDETCFVAFYDGQVGIHAEIELDFGLAGDGAPETINGTNYLAEDEFELRVALWKEKLRKLSYQFPKTHFFLTYGEQTYMGRLVLNAFTPLLNGRLPGGQALAPESLALMISPYHGRNDIPDISICPTIAEIADELYDLAYLHEPATP